MDIKEYFKKLRFDEKHHLGMGDIRLTMGQQEEIEAAFEKQNAVALSKLNGQVIKRVCSEATEDCSPCICQIPHEKAYDYEDEKFCSQWNYCHYKGRKVRCTKVL